MSEAPWRIGELARRTGLSVRALRFYDEIGLLSPSERTTAGHRLYGKDDLVRLHHVRTLRQLGLSLEEIQRALAKPDWSTREMVATHLQRLRGQMEQLTQLCRRLEHLAHRIETSEEISAEELITVIEEITMYDKYYTPEQLAELKERGETLGQERIHQVEQEWKDLIAAVGAEMAKKTPASDPHVVELANRWMALIREFTGGSPGIEKSLGTMMKNEPAAREKAGFDPAMFQYVREAVASQK
jgi:DNA-binding transcriptional MerR regulator